MRALKPDKNLLIDLYVNKGMTLDEVCVTANIKTRMTLIKYMREYGIPSRDTNHERSLIARHSLTDEEFKEILFDLYVKKQLSSNEIAEKYDVSHVIIKRYLVKYNIPTRNHKEANKVNNRGHNNKNWKGGRSNKEGYIMVYCPDHPKAIYNMVYEHRLIMENHIGRYLEHNEHVHHINGNKSDNRLENLQLVTSSEHARLHLEDGRFKNRRYNPGRSGLKYISWHDLSGKWRVIYKRREYGRFSTIEEAKRKRDELLQEWAL